MGEKGVYSSYTCFSLTLFCTKLKYVHLNLELMRFADMNN
nr:hypothetical protein [Escherichia coli]